MKTIQLQKALILVTIAAGMFAGGCELIVDFDRTKIPVEVVDAGAFDAAALGDAELPPPGDANVPETSTAADAAPDANDAGIADAAADG